MTHDLKIWPEYFQAILDDRKTFEIRNNDRDYKAWDYLNLREWQMDGHYYTGREIVVCVPYLHVLPDNMVVMSIVKSNCAPAHEQTPTPPAGYRPLEVDEPILSGDRFFAGKHFIETIGGGGYFQGASTEDIQYYRPIPAHVTRSLNAVAEMQYRDWLHRAGYHDDPSVHAAFMGGIGCAPSPVAPEAPKATQGEPTAPERLYWHPNERLWLIGPLVPMGVTEYIRADLVAALRERVKELESFLSPFKDLKGDL